jgi:hypothetical protein
MLADVSFGLDDPRQEQLLPVRSDILPRKNAFDISPRHAAASLFSAQGNTSSGQDFQARAADNVSAWLDRHSFWGHSFSMQGRSTTRKKAPQEMSTKGRIIEA